MSQTTYLPIRIQRIWGQAIRVFVATSSDRWIRSLPEREQSCLRRALNAFVEVREGTDPRVAQIIESSREKIRENEMSGEEPLTYKWFEEARPFVAQVSAIYEALYDWYLAVKEYLDERAEEISPTEMVGLRQILPALIEPSEDTEELDIDEIRGALLDELGQNPDFDIYYWSGTAMVHMDGVLAILKENGFSERKTFPPIDPLPKPLPRSVAVATGTETGDTPKREDRGAAAVPVQSPSSAMVVTTRTNPVTGTSYAHYDVTEDD